MGKVVTCITIENVSYKDFGRERALHKYVDINVRLRDEFHAIENGKYRKLYLELDRDSVKEYWDGLDEFIKTKEIVIKSERPRLKDRGDRYDVNVTYEIEEEF